MNIPYTITNESMTLYIQGEAYTVPRSWHGYDYLVELLNDVYHDEEEILNHVGGYDPLTLAKSFTVSDAVSLDDIEVTPSAIFYKGQEVQSGLARRMLDVKNQGLPLDPWLMFMAKVYENPAEYARQELYDWIERSDLPITDDGDFLAFKRVADNGPCDEIEYEEYDTNGNPMADSYARYVDLHSRSFVNNPGEVVTMPREEVDSVRAHHCSTGLHFASKEYMTSYYDGAAGTAVMLVKVNPADVVSIPNDYNFSKGRTWRYEVLQVLPQNVKPGDIRFADQVVNEPDDDGDWVFIDMDDEMPVAHGTKRSAWQRVKNWWKK